MEGIAGEKGNSPTNDCLRNGVLTPRPENRILVICLQNHPAGHFDALAVYPFSVFAAQKCNYAANVIRQSHAAKRGHALYPRADFRRILHGSAIEYRARRDYICSDLAVGILYYVYIGTYVEYDKINGIAKRYQNITD